jgi:hypothetical protein
MKNSKSEARNPKQIQMTKIQSFKQSSLAFEHWNFRFVSSWSEADASPDIRISDLRFTDVA